jgi:hypothetical protein
MKRKIAVTLMWQALAAIKSIVKAKKEANP